jgi:hypothetical protein
VALQAALVARQGPVELHRDHTIDRSGQPPDTLLRRRGNDVRAGGTGAPNGARERGFVILIAGAETQIDQAGVMAERIVDCRDERGGRRRKLPIEDLDRENLGIRRLLADDGSDGRAVTETIDVIGMLAPLGIDADSAEDALNVRMRGVHAAVDDSDADAAPGRIGEIGHPKVSGIRIQGSEGIRKHRNLKPPET